MRYDDPGSGIVFVIAILLMGIFATLFPEDDQKPKDKSANFDT